MSRPVITKESQRYWLTFAAERVQRPLIWELGKKFDLVFDIRSASVTDKVERGQTKAEGRTTSKSSGPHFTVARPLAT